MTREQATKEATEIAELNRIRMVVTFNPYGENPDEAQNFDYFPKAVVVSGIFKYEKVVKTIQPGGN